MMGNVTRYLGKPFYEAPNCAIYNVDCLKAMKEIPLAFVDLTVTSPPYNIGKEYEQVMPLEDYLNWCEIWISEVYRLTKCDGSFWLNLGYISIPNRSKAIPLSYLLWSRIPFFLIQEIVWNYGAGVAGKRFFSPRNEKFLWCVKDPLDYTFNLDEIRDPDVKYPNQKKNGKIKVNSLGKNPTDVWQIPKVTSGANRSSKERTPHPAQFPRTLIERIVRASSRAEQTVFDPFIGSGTTAIAALQLGRSVVGMEINDGYCQIAAERVERFLSAPQQMCLMEGEFE